MGRFDERSPAARAAAKTDYGTPREVYASLDAQFAFTVDLAAHKGNHKHARYFSPEQDSLRQSWAGETGFLNPPFGDGVGTWLGKARHAAIRERAVIVQLLPARVGTRWWRQYVEGEDEPAGRLRSSSWQPSTRTLWLRWEGLVTGIHYLRERITFDGADDPAKFDCAVVIHASPNRAPPPAAREPASICWGWPR